MFSFFFFTLVDILSGGSPFIVGAQTAGFPRTADDHKRTPEERAQINTNAVSSRFSADDGVLPTHGAGGRHSGKTSARSLANRSQCGRVLWAEIQKRGGPSPLAKTIAVGVE